MVVRGEELIAFGFLMDCLCLSPAPMLLRFSVKPLRIALTAFVFAALTLPVYLLPAVFRSAPVVLLTPVLMALCAYGRAHQFRAAWITLLTGFLLRGLCDYLIVQGAAPFLSAALCIPPIAIIPLIQRLLRAPKAVTLLVRICGKEFSIPAIVDTGNRLTDGGCAVIVIPRCLLSLPQELFSEGPPKGFCLLPARTVAGRALLPAFKPEQVHVINGGKRCSLPNVKIALAPQGEYALIPSGLVERSMPYVRRSPVGMADSADSMRAGIPR